MTRDVTKSGGGGLIEAPKLSPELQKLLNKRKVVASYGGDDGVSSSGAEFREGVWDQPEWVDQRDRDEAKAKLPGFDPLLRPWTHDQIRQQFLLPLWGATKHQNDTNWDAVSIVYPMMLDAHPGWCFRKERLLLAAQHAFAWFPTVQELVAFMEPDRKALLERVEALRKVSESPTQPPKGGVVDVEESIRRFREKQDRERRELVEIMRQRDLAEGRDSADTAVPPRMNGEDDKQYVSRIVSIIGERISVGAKARKRDEERYRRAKEMEAAEKLANPPRKRSPPASPATMKAAYAATGIKPQTIDPPESTVSEQDAPDAERLGRMTADFTTPEEL